MNQATQRALRDPDISKSELPKLGELKPSRGGVREDESSDSEDAEGGREAAERRRRQLRAMEEEFLEAIQSRGPEPGVHQGRSGDSGFAWYGDGVSVDAEAAAWALVGGEDA